MSPTTTIARFLPVAPRFDRPGNRLAAEQTDELAPPHSSPPRLGARRIVAAQTFIGKGPAQCSPWVRKRTTQCEHNESAFPPIADIRPFDGPEAVLAYLARYTHRVAIANSRLVAFDRNGISFKWKDYRVEGRGRYKVMKLEAGEFIRRFLIHVLPTGFHRIRHYGLFASSSRADNIARVRKLLSAPAQQNDADDAANADEPHTLSHPCPCCGGRMIIIETFEPGCSPTTPSINSISIDTS